MSDADTSNYFDQLVRTTSAYQSYGPRDMFGRDYDITFRSQVLQYLILLFVPPHHHLSPGEAKMPAHLQKFHISQRISLAMRKKVL
jgi:hypothetical protein